MARTRVCSNRPPVLWPWRASFDALGWLQAWRSCWFQVPRPVVIPTNAPTRRTWFAVAADARSFYLEFRARNETAGFGRCAITLGTIDANGQLRETSIVGFMPRSAENDYRSKFALPVAGLVGITRLDSRGPHPDCPQQGRRCSCRQQGPDSEQKFGRTTSWSCITATIL